MLIPGRTETVLEQDEGLEELPVNSTRSEAVVDGEILTYGELAGAEGDILVLIIGIDGPTRLTDTQGFTSLSEII